MKSKSAITGKFVTAKTAKDKPSETYQSDDYPARMLRKLVRMIEYENRTAGYWMLPLDMGKLIANIKMRMNWK